MTEETKFVQGNTNEQTDPNTNSGFQNADQGSDGQGGVDTRNPEYQVQVMQKRLQDKDEFIAQLQQENQQTREMYASLEERMQNLSKIEEVLNKRDNQQDFGSQDTSLDEDALVGKVIENLNAKKTQEQMQQNYQSVLERMKATVGEEHIESKVSEAAKANGLTVDDMVETARKSPQAFYKLIGLDNKQQPHTPNPMRGTQTPPQETGAKDFAYYSRMMRENPKEYWKPETQREFRKLFAQDKN